MRNTLAANEESNCGTATLQHECRRCRYEEFAFGETHMKNLSLAQLRHPFVTRYGTRHAAGGTRTGDPGPGVFAGSRLCAVLHHHGSRRANDAHSSDSVPRTDDFNNRGPGFQASARAAACGGAHAKSPPAAPQTGCGCRQDAAASHRTEKLRTRTHVPPACASGRSLHSHPQQPQLLCSSCSLAFTQNRVGINGHVETCSERHTWIQEQNMPPRRRLNFKALQRAGLRELA